MPKSINQANRQGRANQKQRERLFMSAIRQLEGRRKLNVSAVELLGLLLLAALFAIPIALAGAGAYLIPFDFPNIAAGILGVILLGAAYLAGRPERRAPIASFSKEDLPKLFKAIELIGVAMDAPKVDRICFSSSFGSAVSMTRSRGLIIIEIGLHFGLLLHHSSGWLLSRKRLHAL